MESLQMKLDQKKWLDSIKYGKDMCGTYDYCCICDKNEQSPCEKAFIKYEKMSKKRKNKAKAKFNIGGKTLNYRATIVEK